MKSKFLKIYFSKYGIVVFVLVLVVFASFEEGLWDGLVWKENATLFKPFTFLPQIEERNLLTLIVPLLALPQATHYILDGFIWRKQKV